MDIKQSPIIAEQIHLIAIEVGQQKIDAQKFLKVKQPIINVAHRVMHNLDERKMKLEIAFSFEGIDNEQLLFFQIDFHFFIENLTDFYQESDDNMPVFDGNLIATLLGISLSTARGIIFEKLQNSGIKNIIIPVVSPQKLISIKQ